MGTNDLDDAMAGTDPGALVLLNRDDDNKDGIADNGDDKIQPGETEFDDFVPLQVFYSGSAERPVTISQKGDGRVRIFNENGSSVLSPDAQGGKGGNLYSLLEDTESGSGKSCALRMEGYKTGALTLTVETTTEDGKSESHELKVTVFDVELRDVAAREPHNPDPSRAHQNPETPICLRPGPVPTSPKADYSDVAFISGKPQMPQLEARITPPLDISNTVEWQMEIKYDRTDYKGVSSNPDLPAGCSQRHDIVQYAQSVESRNVWKIHEAQSVPVPDNGKDKEINRNFPPDILLTESQDYNKVFCGGNATLSYKLAGFERTENFWILGKNPDNQEARDYMIANSGEFWWLTWAIAQHESEVSPYLYNQFSPVNYDEYNKAYHPRWGTPQGWGMLQADRAERQDENKFYAPVGELWNWKENFASAFKELPNKRDGYYKFMEKLERAYGLVIPPPPYPSSGEFALQPIDVYTIMTYNGELPGSLDIPERNADGTFKMGKNGRILRKKCPSCWRYASEFMYDPVLGYYTMVYGFVDNKNHYMSKIWNKINNMKEKEAPDNGDDKPFEKN
jgi:hypothetical protein